MSNKLIYYYVFKFMKKINLKPSQAYIMNYYTSLLEKYSKKKLLEIFNI